MSENNNSNELGSFLAGFVIGGLVGAAVALILAPQSGEEVRQQIASKSRDLRDQGEERLQQYRELADNRAQEFRERADNLVNEARGQVQETGGRFQEQARIVLDTGKERASQVKEQVSSYVRKDETESETPEDDGAAASE
ncbi:MAG: YtxH domain-containing protein [Anaerolineae bacterium]|jgi:gas vesicle protein